MICGDDSDCTGGIVNGLKRFLFNSDSRGIIEGYIVVYWSSSTTMDEQQQQLVVLVIEEKRVVLLISIRTVIVVVKAYFGKPSHFTHLLSKPI